MGEGVIIIKQKSYFSIAKSFIKTAQDCLPSDIKIDMYYVVF